MKRVWQHKTIEALRCGFVSCRKSSCMSVFLVAILLGGIFSGVAAAQSTIVDFEELTEWSGTSGGQDGQPGGDFYNGDSGIGSNSLGWTSRNVFFNNTFTEFEGGFTAWEGWSYSNVINNVTPGIENQYASSPGGGADGTGGVTPGGQYSLAFDHGAYFNLPAVGRIDSAEITNTTYAYLSMKNGDDFAKKFGGESGDDPDFFNITLTGYEGFDAQGAVQGEETIYLADFRFDNNELDYILNDWTQFSLRSLGEIRSVDVSFASSDVGEFGINTPKYFALDNLAFSAVPEPTGALAMFCVAAGCWYRRQRRRTTCINHPLI